METLIIILILLIIYILNINICKNELFINNFDDKIINSNEEINNKYKFIIYTQNLGLLIAESIGHILKKLNYQYNIVLEITIDDIKKNRKEPNEIYIILFPHTLKNFPDVNKYIIYQLEQYKQSKWITNDYKKKIDNSIFTWEYSLENYNNFEPEYKKKLFYFPVPILNIVHNNNINKKNFKYDIIFVGAPNKRRTNIIKELKKKYKVLFLTKTFNNELYDKMEEAKIILNLHYYKNAILETTRINEALFNNKLVISEEPDEYDTFNKKLYEKNVIFIDEIKDDLSNINQLYEIIDNYLENEKYYSRLLENNNFINKIYEYSFYFLYLSFKKNNLIIKELKHEFKNSESILNDNIKYIKNIILLTCNYNNKDDVEINNLNKIKNKDYFDWYYFTNINNKISGWDVLNNDYYDKKKFKLNKYSINHYFKTQALKLNILNKYSYIIWVDSSYKINNNNFVNDIINILENYPDNNLFVIDNHYSINKNIINNLDIDNDVKSSLLEQYNDYKSVIIDKKIYSTKFFIYKNNNRVENLFDEWWLECKKYDYKLNLSLALNYLLYKKNLVPVIIPNNIINNQNENSSNDKYNKINSSIIKKIILNNDFNEIENLQIDFSKINLIDGIIWINSDKNKKREDYMKNLLKNILIKNYKISEIDSNINIMDTFTNVNFDRKLTNNEIAKILSHIKAINFLEKIDGNYFLICEDNICFKNTVLFDKDLKTIIESSPKFDILMVNKNYLLNIEENYSKWSKYYKPIENEYVGSTSAYIISREGINKFLKLAKYNDSYFKLDKNNNLDIADIYLFKYLDTIVYKYNYIGTKNLEINDNQQNNQDKNNLFQLNIIIKDFHSKK